MGNNFETGHIYHIFNRGNNKEAIFKEQRNYGYFLKLMEKHVGTIAQILCYCLLEDRFHLVFKIKEPGNLPMASIGKLHQPLSNFFNSYAKSINKAYGRSGSLFQEHFFKSEICYEDDLRQLIVSIHNISTKVLCSYPLFFSKMETRVDKEFVISLFRGLKNFKNYHLEGGLIREDTKLLMQRFDD